MKQKDMDMYDEIVESYIPSEPTEPEEATKKEEMKAPSQKAEELINTLAPDVQEALRLRGGRPRKNVLRTGKWTRTSFVLLTEQIEKIRAISIMENVPLRAVVEEAFKNAIDSYESKHGTIDTDIALPKTGEAVGLFTE